jgi:CRISPR-associated endonuclease/helicase Cas3
MDKENTKSQITENLAHVDYESGRCQSMKEHLENVAFMAENSCSLEELKPLIAIIGILHDIGKIWKRESGRFQEYSGSR